MNAEPPLDLLQPPDGWLDKLARNGVASLLQGLHDGELTIHESGRSTTFGAPPADGSGLGAEVRVRHAGFWSDTAFGGALGAAESFVRGDWETPDLTAVIRILARHPELVLGLDSGWARFRGLALRAVQELRRNSRTGARRNIAAHYDLGNEFFAAFLDPTLMYSCAIFPRPDASLEEASRFKLDLICRKLGLSPEQELVEIGTGWGGFAIHAASRYGCLVVTTTISGEQHAEAVARIRQAGLEQRITVLREDYRDLPRLLGRRFDRLVSIEMIEAVGHEFLPHFFQVCGQLLKPEGRGLIQAIVIRDQSYEVYRKSVDFIRRYIFPGGCLPSVARMVKTVAETSPLRVDGLDDFTPHYAATLLEWRQRFHAADLAAFGRDESFRRLWHWYFCYCEAGFLERATGLVQLALAGSRAGVGWGSGLGAPVLVRNLHPLAASANLPAPTGVPPWNP